MREKIKKWYLSHSISYKIIVPVCLLVLLFEIAIGMIFYNIISIQYYESLEQSNEQTAEQMSSNLENQLINIIEDAIVMRGEVVFQLIEDKIPTAKIDYATKNTQYTNIMKTIYDNSDNFLFIESILIIGENDVYYYAQNNTYQLINNNIFDEIDSLEIKESCHWTDIITNEYYFANSDTEIISIIVPCRINFKTEAFCVVNIGVSYLEQYLSSMNINEGAIIIEIGEEIITSSQVEFSENIEDIYLLSNATLSINNWEIISALPMVSQNQALESILCFLVICFVTTGLLMLIMIYAIIHYATRPIINITRKIKEERKAMIFPDYDMIKEASGERDEIGFLTDTYNEMLHEIEEYIKVLQKEQEYKHIMEIKLLQIQIEPHFLYNTLEGVRFLIEMNDDRSREMLIALENFYRLSLTGIREKGTIAEEIEQSMYYLNILKLRFASKYDYSIDVDSDIEECKIPKFILQPLLENAINHGIKNTRRMGLIKIRGFKHENKIVITVWDNGIGFDVKKLKKIQDELANKSKFMATEHIGITNVHQRIHLAYGEPYGLTLESVEGEYTQVTISLPYYGKEK